MRRILFICFIGLVGIGIVKGQDHDRFKKIEAAKIAYITKELELTPKEAERFFPLYNQYHREMRLLMDRKHSKDNRKGEIESDAEIVALKKRYREEFVPIINPQRASRFFEVEREFREELMKVIRQRRKNENPEL
ncbi:hypothetical protein [Olivibacter sitiensis]|uniref:hypothetical protein n=1 Tax=Olivibacter sitiensis TaxID=376470 RepID=UPI0004891525|nr:hypothetical protein [Olivibacter sitiensis]